MVELRTGSMSVSQFLIPSSGIISRYFFMYLSKNSTKHWIYLDVQGENHPWVLLTAQRTNASQELLRFSSTQISNFHFFSDQLQLQHGIPHHWLWHRHIHGHIWKVLSSSVELLPSESTSSSPFFSMKSAIVHKFSMNFSFSGLQFHLDTLLN